MKKRITIFVTLLIISAGIIGLCTSCTFLNSDDTYEAQKLFYTVQSGNLCGMQEILEDDVDIDYEALPDFETTPFQMKDQRALAIAISDADDDFVKALISSGKVSISSDDDYTYLDEIVCNHSVELCVSILDAGADVNAGSEPAIDRLTAFVHPTLGDKEERYQLLLDHGAEIDAQTMQALLRNGYRYSYAKEFLDWMLEHEIDSGLEPALVAAIQGDNERLQDLIVKDDVADKKLTLLFASANCNLGTLELMQQQGYDFSIEDEEGRNLLHIASLCNSEEVVAFLTNLIDIDAVSEDGIQAVTYAAIGGNKESLEYLLNHGAEFQRGELYGKDPANNPDELYEVWTWAEVCSDGTAASVKAMLEVGYIPDQWDCFAAYRYCNEAVFSELIKQGIDFNGSHEGDTVLDVVTETHAEQLYALGAKPSSSTLQRAVEWRNYDLIEKLLNEDIFRKSESKADAFAAAIESGDLTSVKLLIESGIDVNQKIVSDDFTTTPVHIAAETPSCEILEFLIDCGADIAAENSDGMTPYDCAKAVMLKDNMEILREYYE